MFRNNRTKQNDCVAGSSGSQVILASAGSVDKGLGPKVEERLQADLTSGDKLELQQYLASHSRQVPALFLHNKLLEKKILSAKSNGLSR